MSGEVSGELMDLFERTRAEHSRVSSPLYVPGERAALAAVLDRHEAMVRPPGHVVVPIADLETKLNQRVGHSHQRPAIWDWDNGPGKANMPCEECAAETRLREAITIARGDSDASR